MRREVAAILMQKYARAHTAKKIEIGRKCVVIRFIRNTRLWQSSFLCCSQPHQQLQWRIPRQSRRMVQGAAAIAVHESIGLSTFKAGAVGLGVMLLLIATLQT